jgi:membrane protease YdiL (CAAX protease family)
MNRMTLIVLVVEAGLAAVGLVVGWWIGTPILEVTRVDLHSGILALAATLPLVAFVFWGMRTEFAFLARLRNLVRETIVPLFANCSPWEILLISIMAGIGEELFFRGLLQGSLGRVVNPWIALALVSALFGLAHYVSLGYAIIAGLLGAYMGALLLLTGNLFVAMAVHALFDFAALLFISRMTLSPATEPGLP